MGLGPLPVGGTTIRYQHICQLILASHIGGETKTDKDEANGSNLALQAAFADINIGKSRSVYCVRPHSS
jgi:hypothetical protein